MHLAVALGVPVISLFCPTELEDTGPLGYDKGLIIQKPRTCEPCLKRDCSDNFCMRQISVEEVCRAAERMLEHDLVDAACTDIHAAPELKEVEQALQRLRKLGGDELLERLLHTGPLRIAVDPAPRPAGEARH